MPKKDFSISREYTIYSLVDKRRFDHYVSGETLDSPKPGAYL